MASCSWHHNPAAFELGRKGEADPPIQSMIPEESPRSRRPWNGQSVLRGEPASEVSRTGALVHFTIISNAFRPPIHPRANPLRHSYVIQNLHTKGVSDPGQATIAIPEPLPRK